MKNSKKLIKKISVILVTVIALLLITSLPAFAAEAAAPSGNPQIQLNENFDANSAIRTIFSWIIGILAIIGIGIGGFHIVIGQINQDTKERNGGIITLIISLAVGGLMLLLLNMILK